jgi:GNAT superfamily N-acetyltransferase
MELRPEPGADLPALVAALGRRHFFTGRLASQRAGAGVLLVAWVDGQPVGDVYLDREPTAEPAIRQHLPGVPTLTHLEVLGPFQRRGIGTALIHAGEDTARRLGDHHLAIGVGLDNPGASRLSERLGYTASAGEEHYGRSSDAGDASSRDRTQAAKPSIALTTVSKRMEWNRSKACCAPGSSA